MAKKTIPKSPDPITQGFDRRQFLSVGPASLLMASSPPEASPGQFSQEFQALVVEGTRQLMAYGNRAGKYTTATTSIVAVCFAKGVDKDLKERLIALEFERSGCVDCYSKEHGPHLRRLGRCKRCGDQEEVSS